MLKNKNIRYGIFVFLLTLIGLLLLPKNYSSSSEESLSEMNTSESEDLAIKP